MGYADLKNAVVFRKVFGQNPRVLAGLLNGLRAVADCAAYGDSAGMR